MELFFILEKNDQNCVLNVLLLKLVKERNVVIVMDYATYHTRLVKKTPSMNIKKNDMIKFGVKHNKDIPTPIPRKPVLL